MTITASSNSEFYIFVCYCVWSYVISDLNLVAQYCNANCLLLFWSALNFMGWTVNCNVYIHGRGFPAPQEVLRTVFRGLLPLPPLHHISAPDGLMITKQTGGFCKRKETRESSYMDKALPLKLALQPKFWDFNIPGTNRLMLSNRNILKPCLFAQSLIVSIFNH